MFTLNEILLATTKIIVSEFEISSWKIIVILGEGEN